MGLNSSHQSPSIHDFIYHQSNIHHDCCEISWDTLWGVSKLSFAWQSDPLQEYCNVWTLLLSSHQKNHQFASKLYDTVQEQPSHFSFSVSQLLHDHFAYKCLSSVIVVHVKSNSISVHDKYHHKKVLIGLVGADGSCHFEPCATLIDVVDHFHHL